MLRLAFVLTLLPTLALADVTGPARVVDGDTIEIAGERIRLHGIDARMVAVAPAGSDGMMAGA
jgi:endonuclease YncB( thermonuclease family)